MVIMVTMVIMVFMVLMVAMVSMVNKVQVNMVIMVALDIVVFMVVIVIVSCPIRLSHFNIQRTEEYNGSLRRYGFHGYQDRTDRSDL